MVAGPGRGDPVKGIFAKGELLCDKFVFFEIDQMLRINATSGLYRPEKSPEYYEHTAMKAVRENAERFQPKREQKSYKPRPANGADKGGKKRKGSGSKPLPGI